MEVIKHQDNVHSVKLKGDKVIFAQLGCVHWDNSKCDRNLLKKHLDYCKENSIPILFNGDLFCLMQGRGDRRSSKDDILPEHNNSHYLDSIVDTAIDYFSPYAHLITVAGYGNHETAIIKFQETDILKRFVNGMNTVNGTNIQVGGYGGWVVWSLKNKYGENASFKHKYFHGSGGGGIVTKGAINLTRALQMYEGMDSFGMNHIHENWARTDVRDVATSTPKNGFKMEHKKIELAVCGTYKEEYGTGGKGWHIERGAPPKPLGGRLFEYHFKRLQVDGTRTIIKNVRSFEFPFI